MRITSNTIFNQAASDINKAATRLLERQRQVTKRMATASDDPIGASLAVSLRETMAKLLQAQQNGDLAEAKLESSEGALTGILSVLEDVKDLAVQSGGPDKNDLDRQAYAAQVNRLLDGVLSDANTRSIDGYLFGGTQTTVAPFSATRVSGEITAVTANSSGTGIAGQIEAELPGGLRVVTNVPGSPVFTSATPTAKDVFPLLIKLRDDLRAGNVASVAASITDLDAAVDKVRVVIADVGSRRVRVGDIQLRSQSDMTNLKGRLSKIEDPDVADAAIKLQQAQIVYQAALSSAAKSMQISLVDFLR